MKSHVTLKNCELKIFKSMSLAFVFNNKNEGEYFYYQYSTLWENGNKKWGTNEPDTILPDNHFLSNFRVNLGSNEFHNRKLKSKLTWFFGNQIQCMAQFWGKYYASAFNIFKSFHVLSQNVGVLESS